MSRNLTPSQLVRQCEVCGKDFVTERFAVSAGYGRFCNRVCGGIGRRVERTPIKKRFWAMVNKEGPIPADAELGPCWLWTGAVNRGDNGKIGSHGKTLLAHRLAYEWEFGAIPEDAFVRHRCGQTLCVRAAHLFLYEHPVIEPKPEREPSHGMTGSLEYSSWQNMKARCTNPNNPRFPDYGGRGVKVSEHWLHDFAAFFADMGPIPSPEHSIDRFPDKNGNYEPGNCRWATETEQQQNRRSNHLLTFRGETLCIAEWSRRLNLTRRTIRLRLARGWTVEQTLGQSSYDRKPH